LHSLVDGVPDYDSLLSHVPGNDIWPEVAWIRVTGLEHS
jgi:hypothetical protein